MRRDRAKIIELNDQLRTTFRGGRVQMTPDVYGLEPRLRGRALFFLSKYRKFSAAMLSNGVSSIGHPRGLGRQKIRPMLR
jgi:hypothetical protein